MSRLSTYCLGGFTIQLRSIAGQDTSIILGADGLNCVFDLGRLSQQAVTQPIVFLTHGHMDHVGCLPMHAATRSLYKLAPPLYLVPPSCKKPALDVLDAFRAMDGSDIPALVESIDELSWIYLPRKRNGNQPSVLIEQKESECVTSPADDLSMTMDTIHTMTLDQQSQDDCKSGNVNSNIRLINAKPNLQNSAGYLIRPWRTIHRVESFGYVIWRISRRLKPELQGLPGEKIGQMRRENIDIMVDTATPVIAVSGDTTLDGILKSKDACNASVLIMECTFLDDKIDVDGARERGHVHLDEFASAWAKSQFKNDHILLAHFSARYSASQIRRTVSKALLKAFCETHGYTHLLQLILASHENSDTRNNKQSQAASNAETNNSTSTEHTSDVMSHNQIVHNEYNLDECHRELESITQLINTFPVITTAVDYHGSDEDNKNTEKESTTRNTLDLLQFLRFQMEDTDRT